MKLSTLQEARRAKIIDAALHLFRRDGLRGASMEAVAAEAGVAKPTLYKYFPDKDALFAAVVVQVVGQYEAVFTTALTRPGPAHRRVGDALAAKHKFTYRLMDGSAHAAELLGAGRGVAAAEFAALEVKIEAQITGVLAEAGIADPEKMARLLIACASGIGARASVAEQIGPAMRLVAEKLLA